MGAGNASIYAFNRGLVSKLGLARSDIDRTRMSAEVMTNWVPRVLGSMMLRPGLMYKGATLSNNKARFLPFIYSALDTAFIEFTDSVMRVWVGEAPISRPSVSAAVSNGTFNSDLTDWTDSDQSGCTSAWATGGYMSLLGTTYNAAVREQTVTVTETGTEHALRVVVAKGKATLKVGTASGDDSYVSATLGVGTHSLAFTPTDDFYIWIGSYTTYATLIDSITVESSGGMQLPSPYAEADLGLIRYDQSADVIYLSCDGYHPKKVQRFATRSWSLVDYAPEDGPFMAINTGPTQITPSAIFGDITLTASKSYFTSTMVGALMRISSSGQSTDNTLTGGNQWSDYIEISGTGTSRNFTFTVSGTWSGTITQQYSVGAPGAWVDSGNYYTSNTTVNATDPSSNTVIYYRYGFKSIGYSSGSARITITTASGSIVGTVRITAVASATSASASVLKNLGGTAASDNWYEGQWSERRGYPSAVALYNGRLWWAGKARIIGSVSGTYESFDDTIEGDSGPINSLIGAGPVDSINWLLPIQKLLIGTDMREIVGRSSSLDEPLTPSNFNLKFPSSQGSSPVNPVIIDQTGLFVQRSGTKIFKMDYQGEYSSGEYQAVNVTEIIPEIGGDGIVQMAAQRQPDTRVHCVRTDGKVALLVSQPSENVICWVLLETDGAVEDVFTMPGDYEDKVYYVVRRTINGSTVRYLERWSLESECVGGALNKQADAAIVYSGTATATISGLDHLIGETVVCWADGADKGTFTVSAGGTITLPAEASNAVVGLPYTAQYQTSKLVYFAQGGTALNQPKKVAKIGVVLKDTHAFGLQYGRTFDDLYDLPSTYQGAAAGDDTIYGEYDEQMFPFNGTWSPDARVCLQAAAPRPVTVLALTMAQQTNEG